MLNKTQKLFNYENPNKSMNKSLFKRRKFNDKFINTLFLLPMIIPFLITVLIPFFVGIYYSMTDWNGFQVNNFVGLANYRTIFENQDFIYSLLITVIFTVISIIVINVIAFALALLCTTNMKFNNFCRAAFFLPNMVGGIVLGYVWMFIFNRVFILIYPTSFLTDPNLSLVALIIVSTWQAAGYMMMIYITGLQTIDTSILEASEIDGASAWTTMRRIKIPLVMNTFTICVFLTLVRSFQMFDLNFALTGGGPATVIDGRVIQSTELIALNIYNSAILRQEFALGQAKAVLFFLVLVIISLTQVWISKKSEVEI